MFLLSRAASSVFLLSLCLVSTVESKKEWKFPRYAIVNFDTKSVGNNLVQFHAGMRVGAPSILTDVEFTKKRTPIRRFPIFQARVVDRDDVNAKLTVAGWVPTALFSKKALIYMHGFNVFPREVFQKCAEYEEERDRLVIPLIWKSKNSGPLGYCPDRKVNAPGAADSFRPLIDVTKGIRKSLLCHSMGNYVLRLAARASLPDEEPFEDIFMVAADVHRNIFDAGSNNHTDPTLNDGLEIVSMTKRRVHVLHSHKDTVMWWRPLQLCTLGQIGLGHKGYRSFNDLHEEVRDSNKLAPLKDCSPFSNINDTKHHSYQFTKPAIDYYENVMDS